MKLLLEHIDTLLDDPAAIPHLNQAILQLAVQGKLVPQDAKDEPAEVLLARIQSEKSRLIKAGKLKKEKPLPEIGEEVPHSLPDSWEWCRLEELSENIHYGYTASADHANDRIRLLRITDIQNNSVDWGSVPGCEIKESDYPKYALKDNDILIARTGGTIGKSYLVHGINVKAVFASYLIRLIPFKSLDAQYLKLFLESPFYWDQLIEMSSGTGQPNVNATSLKSLIFPLPPLAEQRRIVARVDQLLAFTAQLEAQIREARESGDRLLKALLHGLLSAADETAFQAAWDRLCRHFDLAFTRPAHIQELRAAILQLAVQGRLVRQEPDDEPATVLLDRIQAEKARLIQAGKLKKEKPLPEIGEEEAPYEVPEGWVWCRLGELGLMTGGGTPSKGKPEYWDGDILWVSPKDMKSDIINDSELKVTQLGVDSSSAKIIPEGSLLIVGRSGILKRTLPVSINAVDCTVNQDLKVLIPHLKSINFYIQLMLRGHEQFILKELVKYGMTVHSLKYKEFEEAIFPLPPLAEQHRIVARVDALLGLCDVLEAKLAEATEMRERELEVVMNHG